MSSLPFASRLPATRAHVHGAALRSLFELARGTARPANTQMKSNAPAWQLMIIIHIFILEPLMAAQSDELSVGPVRVTDVIG